MLRFAFLLAALSAIVGCARMDVTTDIQADGSFKRQIVYTLASSEEGGMVPTAKPDEVFILPKAAPGLTVTQKTVDKETVITSVRTIAAGQKAVKDAIVLSNKKPQIENEATVTALGDGRWVYSEKLHWTGEQPPDKMPDSEFRAIVKKALPPTADTATIDRVTKKAMVSIWHVLFGPSEPLLSQLVMHQSLAEKRFRQRVAKAFDSTLAEEGVSAESRKAVLQKVMQQSDMKSFFDPQSEAKKQQSKPEPSSGGGFVPLMFTAKVPGTVVETNGETDPVTGEVFWALYPESCAVGDVELRVVYKP